jgi:putative addiction module killer protein
VIEIRQTAVYSKWFVALRDLRARTQILRRVERMEAGNPGDVAAVGNGISEMRIHYGPGYRLYFTQRGNDVVLLLCGGDKNSQARDIVMAKQIAKELNL